MRVFKPDEVDKLIPRLEFIFSQVYGQMAELVRLRKELDDRGLPSIPDELEKAEVPEELEPTRARYLELVRSVAGQLGKIGEMGGMVRDLDLGVVDFPGVVDGRKVLLCWRYGEKVLSHYHEPWVGYMARRPINLGRVAMASGLPN